ncbi:hypothetical protein [Dolichospermum phage Dfl-JY45]
MRLIQLRDYLNELIAAGVDGNTVVCAPFGAGENLEFGELNRASLATGPFREDPAPLMPAPLCSTGQTLILSSVLQSVGGVLNSDRYDVDFDIPEVPEKSWPYGHWYKDPVRPKGVI